MSIRTELPEETQARLTKWVIPTRGGCWEWTGCRNKGGYGTTRWRHHESALAHRVSYSVYREELTPEQFIDHLCGNRACINPWHMEVVPFRVNVARGIGPTARNGRKTHCKRGHEFTPENTMPVGSGQTVGRKCRACHNELHRQKAYAQKHGLPWPPNTKRTGW